jgi:Peptidase family M23
MWTRAPSLGAIPGIVDRFGIRGRAQMTRDLKEILARTATPGSVTISLSSAGLIRPALSLPSYLGFVRTNRIAPIFNLFDRTAGGRAFRGVATRKHMRDYRGGRLSYDEHDGTDFVCPPGTPLTAAAPGVLVAVRDTFLRGGITACVDHGAGLVTQYTHLSRVLVEVGARLERGQVLALSGHGGVEMTTFFPWVPPHLHFSVWLRGIPIDPYLTDDETRTAGTWIERNQPVPCAPRTEDEAPDEAADIAIERDALRATTALCREPRVREEIERAPSDAARAALIEDDVHHHREHWPEGIDVDALRPRKDASRVRLSLPLTTDLFDGAVPEDTWATRPR